MSNQPSSEARIFGGVPVTPILENEKPYLCFEMPSQLQMLLNKPAVPHKVASQHAWNKDDRSLHISIKENDEFTIHRDPVAQSTDGIRSKVGYTSGLHLFEINWPCGQRGTNAVVGVSTVEAPLHHHFGYHHLVGSNAFSWGWDLSRKMAYHDREGINYPFFTMPNERYHVPDKFYAVLNMDAGVLGFVVKGEYLGAAFHGLRGKKLYLTISAVWGHAEVTMRYHGGYSQPTPLMELCRHAVRKAIKQEDQEDAMDELQIPNILTEYLKNGNRPYYWTRT